MRTSHTFHALFFLRLTALFLAALFLSFSFAGCRATVLREDEPSDIPAFNGQDPSGDGRPRVALTYDDGPNHYGDRTKNYVTLLKKYGYSATFFVVGNRVAGGDSVKYLIENGMEVGIHGWSHEVYYDGCSEEEFLSEMNKTADAIHEQVPNYSIKLMRPVGGHISAEIADICPYAIIQWSQDSLDYEHRYAPGDGEDDWNRKVDTIVNNVLQGIEDGDIILMHDIYESTYDASVILLERLYEMGYDVVSVSELLGNTEPGVSYYRR